MIEPGASPVSPEAREAALAGRFLQIDDPQERMAVVMAHGKKWPPVPENERAEELIVPGCSSRVWLAVSVREGKTELLMAADSVLVQGLASLICEVYQDAALEDVVAFPTAILERCGLWRQLSPTRQNGLESLRQTIQLRTKALLSHA